jgi:hypothetical protein
MRGETATVLFFAVVGLLSLASLIYRATRRANKDAPRQAWGFTPVRGATSIGFVVLGAGTIVYGAAHSLSWAGRILSDWGGGFIMLSALILDAGVHLLMIYFGIPTTMLLGEPVAQGKNSDTTE